MRSVRSIRIIQKFDTVIFESNLTYYLKNIEISKRGPLVLVPTHCVGVGGLCEENDLLLRF